MSCYTHNGKLSFGHICLPRKDKEALKQMAKVYELYGRVYFSTSPKGTEMNFEEFSTGSGFGDFLEDAVNYGKQRGFIVTGEISYYGEGIDAGFVVRDGQVEDLPKEEYDARTGSVDYLREKIEFYLKELESRANREQELVQQSPAKVRVFIEDGIVHEICCDRPEAVDIVVYNTDSDDCNESALQAAYDECQNMKSWAGRVESLEADERRDNDADEKI